MGIHGLGGAKSDSDLGEDALGGAFHAPGEIHRRSIRYVRSRTPITDRDSGVESRREWGTRPGRQVDERAASTRREQIETELRHEHRPLLEAGNLVEYDPWSGAIRPNRSVSLHDDVF